MVRHVCLTGLIALAICSTAASSSVRGTSAVHAEHVVRPSSGMDANVSMLALVGLVGLAFLMTGVRQRAELAGALARERELTRRLCDASASGIVIVDAHGRIVDWNPAMVRLTGRTRRQVLRTPLAQNRGFEDPRHVDCLRVALHGIDVTTDAHAPARAQSHTRSWLSGCYSPLRNPAGDISGALVIIAPPGELTAAAGERVADEPAA